MRVKLLYTLFLSTMLVACGGSNSKSPSNNSSSIFSSSSSTGVASSTSSISSSSNQSSSEGSHCSASTLDLANVRPLSRSILNGTEPETEVPVDDLPEYVCEAGLYFCDDFSAGMDKWNLLPTTEHVSTPDGVFDLLDDNGNNVLRYTADKTGGVIALVDPAEFTGVTSADYYVEARIRPRANGTTGNKQIYLLARYQDGNNWYAGALNVQNATTSTQVEIAMMKDGVLSRPLQVKRPLEQGARDATDGTWYTLRIELIGDALTVYLDGEMIGSRNDATFTSAGLIGLWTANKSFEIDDIKVGNATDKPAQLTIAPASSTYAAEVNDEPYVIDVTAISPSGVADNFTVVSSDSSVVSVSIENSQVALTPVGEGTAVVTITSGSDATLTRRINATIAPEFVLPVATYDLECAAFPAPGSVNVHVDTRLTLTFDDVPSFGEVGAIRIFKADDDTLVDSIKLAYEKDTIGAGSTTRTLNTLPIQLTGNTVTIDLHSNALDYNTTYYVAISASVFPDAVLAGETFAGIGKDAGWSFTTREAPPAPDTTELKVGTDGATSDFGSVQGALNFVMKNIAREIPVTIEIANGVYEELLYLNNKDNLTIRGESRDGVIIQYRNSEGLNGGSEGRNVFLIANSDLVTLENLTLRNTTLIGEGGQAEALYFNSQDRLIAKHVNFFSEQDTVQVKGYSWFYQTLIAGNVDYIWGNNHVALFEESEIRSIGRSSGHNNGGIILQARTVNATDKGFVFLNSELTRGEGPTGEEFADDTVWLARSDGSNSYYDNIVFVNTKMDSHIRPAGWSDNPVANPSVPSAVSGWREYNSMNLNGESLDVSGWTRSFTLSQTEYEEEFADRAKIFSAYGEGAGWNPQP